MESSRPRFYKFFTVDTCATDLELPQHVQLALPKTVTIQDKYYNNWQVHARRIGGSWYFLDGWEDFVKDNSITPNVMLRFQYTREGLFDVKLYGVSGCEEKGVGHSKHNCMTPNMEPVHSEQPRRKRSTIHWRGEGIFGDVVPKPKRPYIVRKFGAHRKNEVYIPKEMLNDKELDLPVKLKLEDPKGRTYTTWFRQWGDTRSFYIGGWARLLNKNHITEDDICILEFDHKTNPKRMYVSFLKVDRSI